MNEIKISKEDLNWLYFGDDYTRMITGESKFKNEIYESMHMYNRTIVENLAIFIANIYNNRYTKEFLQSYTEGEIERLKLLDQKYNLYEYYNNVMGGYDDE